ncbi:MAG: hypothetical protein IJY83_05795 [Oscillospiraceae bacterium]|nr:hypothetical protein [Oscillospiraceae bacterium]
MQFVRIIKKLGNAQTNEHINKVGACNEKLFFIRNIGNGLFAVANGIIRTPAREQAQPSARGAFCLLFCEIKRRSLLKAVKQPTAKPLKYAFFIIHFAQNRTNKTTQN